MHTTVLRPLPHWYREHNQPSHWSAGLRSGGKGLVGRNTPGRRPALRFVKRSLCLVVFVLLVPVLTPAADVSVFVPTGASSAERIAGRELAHYLGQLYPNDRFSVADRLPEAGRGIVVGCATNGAVRRWLNQPAPTAAESFVVTSRRDGPRELGVIAGADPRGVVYGAYALLEKLGCGFCLSGDALPAARQDSFSFNGWQLADRPFVRNRIVFDWHNFLSGCSTWNLEHWQAWIRQSQKMGYNAVMVHAYGNNPMVSFTFNGKTKPVGYLSTTAKGRDWSTMHVNDVRRLWGGGVFNQPVFGADAAMGPDDQRAMAAQTLMQGVFASAGERAMEVYFAADVDTGSANPQDLILTLPESARFAIQTKAGGMTGVKGEGDRSFWLANPETPEGYRYYRAQVQTLLATYPQITCLVVWFRAGGTPWMEMKVAEMPAAWQEEYQAEITRTPDAAKLWHAPQIFALGKVVHAFDRALKELGHARVQLASGTWRFDFLAPCHRFFPPHVKLIGLDYNVLHDQPQLGNDTSRQVIRDVGAHRPVIPVIWAHHDDGNYIGRPYTPFPEFYTKLRDAKADGFGVIHWTTRPLDLFFTSHAKQVWQSTQDQPLRTTCNDMAARSFGPTTRDAMGAYLERWVTDAPKFARDTSDWFIDRPLTNITEVVSGCRARLKLIEAVDQAGLTPAQRDRVSYFKGLEEFIIAFHQTQGALQDAQALVKKGDLAAARQAMAACRPEAVIEQYAKFSSLGGITRGEQGLVVSMNLRWLPHFLRYRQALGLEPVRLSFGSTSHDPLAQSSGKFTFDVSAGREFWLRWGNEETGGMAWSLPANVQVAVGADQPRSWAEICRSGVESGQPLRLRLQPILRAKGQPAILPAGRYRLRLLFAEPQAAAAAHRVFEVAVGTASPSDRVELFRPAGEPIRVVERRYEVTVGSAGHLDVTLTPVQGKALICGAVLEPVSLAAEAKP